jgi:succinyl-CoA synthetase beta subunit
LNLHEYQSKQRFSEYGIPVPPGEIASTPDVAKRIAQKMSDSVMIKAQVLVGNRIQKGGILVARTPDEARRCAELIIGMEIQGHIVRKVLVEPAVYVNEEIYLGITNDRTARKPVLVASAEGGVELEEIAQGNPEAIVREHIDPLMGLHHYQTTAVANNLNLPREQWGTFGEIAQALYRCYAESDATLAEINPLVITAQNDLVAVDGKMVIDENALYRQQKLAAMRDTEGEIEAVTLAREIGVTYVKLGGQIGCMVNGAGLAMATMDIIRLFGGDAIGPANFLDIGGGAPADKVAAALRIVLTDPDVRLVLINIFAGITRCDEVMRGIIAGYQSVSPCLPMIIRVQGTNDAEALELLHRANIPNLSITESLTEAARKAVEGVRSLP